MWIEQVEILNYRNITEASFKPHANINVFVGENAQGKTNFLEVFFTTSWGKGFRKGNREILIKWGKPLTNIKLQVVLDNGISDEIIYNFDKDNKYWMHAGKEYKTASKLRQKYFVLMFAPHMTQLYWGPAEARRIFFDYFLSLIFPNYSSLYRQYERALLQRNHLLKQQEINEYFKSYTDTFVQLACTICEYRHQFVRMFEPILKEKFLNIFGEDVLLTLNYSSPQQDVNDFKILLEQNLSKELHLGYTNLGPHRDDYFLYFNKTPVAESASQGQHRLLVIATLLAEIELIKEKLTLAPIVLLDDLGSELDQARSHFLVNEINKMGCQCFITTTRYEQFKELKAAHFFIVEQGNISSCQIHSMEERIKNEKEQFAALQDIRTMV